MWKHLALRFDRLIDDATLGISKGIPSSLLSYGSENKKSTTRQVDAPAKNIKKIDASF